MIKTQRLEIIKKIKNKMNTKQKTRSKTVLPSISSCVVFVYFLFLFCLFVVYCLFLFVYFLFLFCLFFVFSQGFYRKPDFKASFCQNRKKAEQIDVFWVLVLILFYVCLFFVFCLLSVVFAHFVIVFLCCLFFVYFLFLLSFSGSSVIDYLFFITLYVL